jgi:5'-3' exonuclease
MRIALIDGDPAIHVFSYFNRDHDDSSKVEADVDDWVSGILEGSKAEGYSGFIQGTPSHRHQLFPSYKAHRPPEKDYVKKWKPFIRDRLFAYWDFQIVNGVEVDDAIASAHCQLEEPIICSRDKDFHQLSGLHYDPKTKEIVDISRTNALKNLLAQIVSGDSTDNVKGIPGIGPMKSRAFDTYKKVVDKYVAHHGDVARGLLDFAENTIQITLKRNEQFQFTITKV